MFWQKKENRFFVRLYYLKSKIQKNKVSKEFFTISKDLGVLFCESHFLFFPNHDELKVLA